MVLWKPDFHGPRPLISMGTVDLKSRHAFLKGRFENMVQTHAKQLENKTSNMHALNAGYQARRLGLRPLAAFLPEC